MLSIELYAESMVGITSSVTFDHIRLNIEQYSPLTLTAVGSVGQASHVTTAVVTRASGPAKIVTWSEP